MAGTSEYLERTRSVVLDRKNEEEEEGERGCEDEGEGELGEARDDLDVTRSDPRKACKDQYAIL